MKGIAAGIHKKVVGLIDAEERGRLLDIPCGKGELAEQLKNKGFEVFAADINGDNCRDKDTEFVNADLNKILPFDDGSFDYVTCIEGPEHIENIYHLFRELARVVKKGGKLIVSTPNMTSVFSRLRFFLIGYFDFFGGYYGDKERMYTYHINPVWFPLLKLALGEAGFEIEEIRTNRDVVHTRSWGLRVLMLFLCPVIRKITSMKIKDEELRDQLNSREVLKGEIIILKCVRR